MFSVYVLGYSDEIELLRRCLSSVVSTLDSTLVDTLVIGLNAPSAAVRTAATDAAAASPVPASVIVPAGDANVGKYPLMRRMFAYGAAPYVMWFDDDSYLRPPLTTAWWSEVATAASGCTLLGSPYQIGATTAQRQAVMAQPWYAGLPPLATFRFVTGGWWVAERAFLRRWDYPFPALHHRGGDMLLGELCRQQRARMCPFNRGVAINADATGGESRGRRKGLSVTTKPLWHDRYDRDAPQDLSHHAFEVTVVGPTSPHRRES